MVGILEELLKGNTNMKIKKISHVGRKNVYDIAVDKHHHYVLKNKVITHNSGTYYTANSIFVITKSQEKDGSDLTGWNFTINIEKSRFTREKSKFTFTVLYGGGVQKYSGLFDIGLETGYIVKTSAKTYSIPSLMGENSTYRKNIEQSKEVMDKILNDPVFSNTVKEKYSYSTNVIINDDFETDDGE